MIENVSEFIRSGSVSIVREKRDSNKTDEQQAQAYGYPLGGLTRAVREFFNKKD